MDCEQFYQALPERNYQHGRARPAGRRSRRRAGSEPQSRRGGGVLISADRGRTEDALVIFRVSVSQASKAVTGVLRRPNVAGAVLFAAVRTQQN